jgi:hypothetical protein
VIIISSFGFGIISVIQFNLHRKFFAKKLSCKKADLYFDFIDKNNMSHFKGIFANGGTGYLLQDKIVFVPHKYNLSRKTITILFVDIENISEYKIWGIIDIGMEMTLKSKKKERFAVNRSGDFYRNLIYIMRST